MAISNAGCCAAVLNQQHQQTTEHCTQGCNDGQQAFDDCHRANSERYTVVENGRVVVKLKNSGQPESAS